MIPIKRKTQKDNVPDKITKIGKLMHKKEQKKYSSSSDNAPEKQKRIKAAALQQNTVVLYVYTSFYT